MMRSRSEHEHDSGEDLDREFALLSEVERTPDTTQRQLAGRLDVSLGVINLLLRSVTRKGYMRMTRATWRRWFYALTPQGIMQRVRLTVAYMGQFLSRYQTVKQILREELEPLALHAESRVAIYGTGEFAELVYLALKDLEIEEMDFFASATPDGSKFLGMVVNDLSTLKKDRYDRVIIAELSRIEEICAELRANGIDDSQMVTLFGDAQQLSRKERSVGDDAHLGEP